MNVIIYYAHTVCNLMDRRRRRRRRRRRYKSSKPRVRGFLFLTRSPNKSGGGAGHTIAVHCAMPPLPSRAMILYLGCIVVHFN